MRILLAALAMFALSTARAADPLESLVFTNGQGYTLADFAGSTVVVVTVYGPGLLGAC
jgi:hypothetical protein